MHRKKTSQPLERRECGLIDVKATAKDGTFTGYGAVFNNLDSYGDVIAPGAFAESLEEWKSRGKLPPMLLQHGGFLNAMDMVPVGKWLEMEENSKGLKVRGELFARDTERGQYIYESLKAGSLDGLSIGFMVRESQFGTEPGEPERTLTKIDLWELSIVTFPANPKARISDVKNLTTEELRELESALRDEGVSRTDSKKVVSILRDLFRRDAGMPEDGPRDEVAPDEAVLAADQVLSSLCSALLGR